MATDTDVDTYDLIIRQGHPFTRTFTFRDTDTNGLRTGLSLAEARIKPRADSSTVLLDLDAYLTVDEPTATAQLTVPQAIVDALSFKSPAVWDLYATFAGTREPMFTGTVTLKPNVTD